MESINNAAPCVHELLDVIITRILEVSEIGVARIETHSLVNLEILVDHLGDLPARSGIGSSSAFTVGLINSLCALTKGRFLGRTELANLAIDIEQNKVLETVGIQDQCASAFGGFVLINANKHGITPLWLILYKLRLR